MQYARSLHIEKLKIFAKLFSTEGGQGGGADGARQHKLKGLKGAQLAEGHLYGGGGGELFNGVLRYHYFFGGGH